MPYTWSDFISECKSCKACALSETRNNVVIYRGSVHAPMMIVGEGPGASEDIAGIPFVGQAGKLLDLLLRAYGFEEKDFHICNIVKCRPPNNRVPTPPEAKSCMPLLGKQIRFARPKVIVLLGKTACKYFLNTDEAIGKLRGRFIEKNDYLILPTFHPAYILRNNNERITLWKDIGTVRERMEELDLIARLSDIPSMPQGRG
ncbi:MAG: uracil-DNA glycosylase [Clostridiaceae bacterium]|nr:uracil-DNA glycosylase [Clostridiaceae bacterium]